MNERELDDAQAEAELWIRKKIADFEAEWSAPQEESPMMITEDANGNQEQS